MTIRVTGLDVAVGQRQLLSKTNFEIASGKLTVLVGGSGSGKSTLLRVLAGLEPQSDPFARVFWSGSIDWNDEGTRTIPRIGLVFQQPALIDELSSLQNIQLAIDHCDLQPSINPSAKDSNHDSAKWWLEHLEVPSNVKISRLSGGQRQRLSLAQVLAGKPKVLIYDEPTTGLDAHTAQKVARLIHQTQIEEGITSIVVTHDYGSFLPIADDWLILDNAKRVVSPCNRESITRMLEEVASQPTNQTRRNIAPDSGTPSSNASSPESKLTVTSSPASKGEISSSSKSLIRHAIEHIQVPFVLLGACFEWSIFAMLALLPRFPKWKWGIRFLLHYSRLVYGGTGLIYLAISGLIIGFVSTFFTLKYMPYKIYTEPLLMEELMGVIGFALYRILIPVLTSVLVAARCSAAVSADLGNKVYGGQIESMRLIQVPPSQYLFTSVLWAFLIGTCLLNQVAYCAAEFSSLSVHLALQPALGAPYWGHYFHQPLRLNDSWHYEGFWWLTNKLLLSALGTAVLTYALALRPKLASNDVSRTITTTILWCTLWVLLVHMLSAFVEFEGYVAR